jgi:polysaccharide export outer membrane protein
MGGDILILTFTLSIEFNETVSIQPDGYISLVNAGSVYVQGLTLPELTEAVKTAYAGVLRDPIVTVDLKDFQKASFYISGQVLKPGQYDLRYDLTTTQAIAIAGGLTLDAKGQAFVFHRVSTDWVKVRKVNVNTVLHGKNLSEDIHLQPGDMIFIPTNFITKFRQYIPYTIGAYLNPSAAVL